MTPPLVLRTGTANWLQTLTATTRMSVKRNSAYMINIIRSPVFPAGVFLSSYLAWRASGASTVDGVNIPGFLLTGMFGMICWSSAVWNSGSSIEEERFEGTIAALFMSPASRIAVVFGHGLGGFLFLIPSFITLALIGLITGAQFNVASFASVGLSALLLVIASLTMGFLLASFFILTRRANLMANLIQHPLYLIGGFMVPRDQLPTALHTISGAVPIAHAVDAFRASMLTGATLGDITGPVLAALATSTICVLIGTLGIRRVEHAAKRAGQLDLF